MDTPRDDSPRQFTRRTALSLGALGAVAAGAACSGALAAPSDQALAAVADRTSAAGADNTASNPAATPVVVPKPVAQWRFNESSAPYRSSVPGGPALTRPAGSTARRVTTPFGGGIALDGENDFLRVAAANLGPLAIGATTGKVTLAAWVYSNDINNGMVAGCWQESRSDPRRSYALFCDLPMYGGDDMVCMEVSKGGGPTPGYPFSIDYAAEPRKVTRGRWEFYAGTYDGDKATAYLNGTATAFPSYTDNQGATYAKNPYRYAKGLYSGRVDFNVGAVERDGTMINLIKGTIAALRVWRVALTATQVKAIYAAQRVLLQ